jgi:hypothetical protein
MIDVRFPEPAFRTKKEGAATYIFDAIRRSWLLLTPEEWVRQNLVAWMTQSLQYPAPYIALEKELDLNGLKKRFDLLVYDRAHKPWMLVECKAPEVSLNEAVLQQVLRYNISVPVPYIVVSNGIFTMAWRKEGSGLVGLAEMPEHE